MPLDPEAQGLLDLFAQIGFPQIATQQPDELRAFLAALNAQSPPGPDVASAEDRTVPGPAGPIPVRIFTPEGDGPFPVFVFYHGGGWVVGNVDGSDAYTRALANACGTVVVSVDYRLAPEHRFPAAIDDCWAATTWAAENAAELGGDGGAIVVGGDSAGGNLAAAVALRARDAGAPEIALQLLLFPVTDHDFETPSYRENAEGYLLQRADMIWFWDHYVPNVADRDRQDASPLRAESLAGVAPAYVITAEYDPLRDEGEAYAKRLQEAGVPTTLVRYDGQIHDFNSFVAAGLTAAVEATDGIAAAVQGAVGQPV